jgi:glutamate--cysteine ligase
MFLLRCLLSESPPDTPQEFAGIVRNNQAVAARGREPGLRLARGSGEVMLLDWGRELLADCEPIAEALDAAVGPSGGTHGHREALGGAVAALEDPASTPSASVLNEMAREHDNSYLRFALAQSLRHRKAIRERALPAEVAQRYARIAEESRAKQREIEAADTVPFEVYRQQYLDPLRLRA